MPAGVGAPPLDTTSAIPFFRYSAFSSVPALLWFFLRTLDVCDCLLRAVQNGMPTVYYRSRCTCNGRCTAVGEPDNEMKRRKALLSEEELLVRD